MFPKPITQDVVASLVSDFAKAKADVAEATARLDALKKRVVEVAEELGLTALHGEVGHVEVVHMPGSSRLDLDKVRRLLDENQVAVCTVTGKPYTQVRFKAAAKVDPGENED